MYFVRTPYIIKKLFSHAIWNLPNDRKEIYLTFDDGPHPEITPWILEQLDKYNAKATFFCLGENASAYPDILQKIKASGHAIGSHGEAHLDGWKISKSAYEENILKGKTTLQTILHEELNLFRPPYGKFKHKVHPQQKTIMWSLMMGDFDQSVSSKKCLARLMRAKPGDIVVVHDNAKARKHLQYGLPKFLEFCKENNYSLEKIDIN